MCIHINFEKTEEFKKNGPDQIIAYKVLAIQRPFFPYLFLKKVLSSPFFPTTWKPGIMKAKKSSNPKVKKVDQGIHVYLYKEDAMNLAKYCDIDCFPSCVVEVTCKKEHLIVIGDYCYANCATFSQVEITEEQYKKAIKIRK